MHLLSLPIGYKGTLHALNDHLASDYVPTESLLDLFLDNKLKPESRNLVLELLHRMGIDWVNMLMQGISQLPKTPDLITKIFVYAIDKRRAEIAKMFTRLLPFNSNEDIQVTLISDLTSEKTS